MTPISLANHELSGGQCKGPSPQSTIDIPKLVLLLAGDPGAFTPLGTLALAGTMATAAYQHIFTAGLNISLLELVVLHLGGSLALLFNGLGRFSFDAGTGNELISGLDQGGGAPETDQPGGLWALTPAAISAKAFRQVD
ncbi:hypothetical protein KBY75_12350 [Cyanobium sp. T1G-Tous]|uniref:DoxX family protein n=1 Tax=unclassified Cyanobium TaxID=2627006 RepID=UPI0020CD60E7|nr:MULTISPECIES: hypothetical protein [unclassified Cyanobium]MCP9804358.1 hypothetical protein [Cyanobium sp. T1G-Tous]MCP9807808.1 hypothetical protein [Cyanobium sp. T1B-Tous]